VVDSLSRSSQPNIWAVGDVTDRMALTPVAIAEAMAFVQTVFGEKPIPPDYHQVPTALFTQPPASTVGLSEADARELYEGVAVYRSRFKPLKHTLSGRQEQSMMKIVVDGSTDQVLGLHMVGPDAGEIIQGFAVAMKNGLTKLQLDGTIGVHPTAAEEFVSMYQPVAD
jgi:glutathione reductase (NADPH)